MLTVQKAVLEKAVLLLNSLGAEYFIQVKDAEPVVKGNLNVKVKKKKANTERAYPHGTFTKMYREHKVDKMNVGDVVSVPIGEFKSSHIQSTLSAFCGNIWGSGSTVTSMNKANNHIEVIRVK